MKCKKIKEDLEKYQREFNELYKHYIADNTTGVSKHFERMDFLARKITFLNNLILYI